MNSHQKTQEYIKGKPPLFRIMIFSVRRPQCFNSRTKSQRLVVTRHRLSCEKVNLHYTLVTWALDACGFSFLFLLIRIICFHSGPLPVIFAATTFFHSVNLIQLTMVLTPFLTFQQWNALPDFFRTSFLKTLILKCRVLPLYRCFCLYILILKIVNNIFLLLLLLLLFIMY